MAFSSNDFYSKYNNPGPTREAAIVNEVLDGNVPTWMWDFIAISKDNKVARDYLCIGTNKDYVRAPMTPYAAQKIADHLGYALPHSRLVDQMWRTATLSARLNPITRPGWAAGTSAAMRYGMNYIMHHNLIQNSLPTMVRSTTPPILLAGHKKDVIGLDIPGHVTIYGWFYPDGRPIQPQYSKHDVSWEDYSHGIRFCEPGPDTGRCFSGAYPQAFINGLKEQYR